MWASITRTLTVFLTNNNAPDAESGEYEVVVYESGIHLGFSAKGTPPDPVQVANVEPRGWAETHGINVGDILLSVGDQQTANMTRRELFTQIKNGARPMRLRFQKPSEESDSEESLLSEIEVPKKKRRSVETMSAGAFGPTASVKIDTGNWRAQHMGGSRKYCVEATQGVRHLGFAPAGVPPAPVTIARLEAHGWALSQHIGIGDELQMVGNRDTSTMSKEDLMDALKGRPVQLTLLRGAAAVAVQVSDAKAALQKVANAARHLREELDTEAEPDEAPMVAVASVKAVAVLTCLSSAEPDDEADPPPAPAEPESDIFVAKVPVGVTELGFSLTSRWHSADALKKMRVKVVDPGGWADEEGIAPGDSLIQVGDRSTLDMTKAELTVKLKLGRRPMELMFKKTKADTARTGRRDSIHAPRRRSSGDVSISAGNALAKLRAGELNGDSEEGSPYTVVAEEGTLRLGFAPAGDPPARVTVARLESHSWAAAQGVMLGDELLRVGERATADMTRAELVASLQDVGRPLMLSFQRPVKGIEAMLSRIDAARQKLKEAARSAQMLQPAVKEQLNKRNSDAGSGRVPGEDKALRALTALAASASSVQRPSVSLASGSDDGLRISHLSTMPFVPAMSQLSAVQ